MEGLRRCFWLPRTRGQAVVWGISLILVAALGLGGLPGFPAFLDFQGFQDFQASTGALAGWSLVLLAVSFLLLWSHARDDYLTARHAAGPIARTFVLLAAAFPLAWAAKAGVPFAPATPEARISWDLTLRVLFTGFGGLTLVLLFSALWRPGSSVSQMNDARRSTLAPLAKLCAGKRIAGREWEQLRRDLRVVQLEASALADRLEGDPAERAEQWRDAATFLSERLRELPAGTPLDLDADSQAYLALGGRP